MADAGLDADVTLDIRSALAQVNRLEEALSRAVTGLVVTADARAVTAAVDAAILNADSVVEIVGQAEDLTRDITAAVDAADTAVIITGDADELTGEVTAAVDAADTGVVVTGDASEITGSITAAVDAADTNVAVTGSIDPGLASGAEALGDSLDAASTSGANLKRLLAGVSTAAAVAALRALADAASDLEESTSKAQVVFGDGFSQIEQFATGAAEAVGLSEQAALEATGTFGNLFQALGLSREAATELSPEVVQLAADLASFNNIGVDEALEKLRSGLIGEVEPLRALGVSFLAADVERKALELGLGDLNGVLTEGEKVQARYALIQEQTSLAQGDFARTSDGLANQQRILAAELQNAAAVAGTALLPAFTALVSEGRDAIPALAQLGEDVLPAVGDALANLAPLLGTTVDLLVLAAPVISAVAGAIALIPPEAIAFAGSMVIASKALGAVQAVGGGAAGAIGKVGTALLTTNPLLLAAGLGAAGLFKEWQAGQAIAAAHKADVDAIASSLSAVGTEYDSSREALEGYIASIVEADEAIVEFAGATDQFSATEVFRTLGLDAKTAADLIAQGPEAVDRYIDSLGELSRAESLAAFQLRELNRQTDDAIVKQLRARDATGLLTDAEADALDALDERGAATEDYLDLLDRSIAKQQQAAAENERIIALYDAEAEAVIGASGALASLAESAPAAAFAIGGLAENGAKSDAVLLAFATTLDGAKLSEEQMAEAAAILGVDVESLTGFIEGATGAVSDFVDEAVGGLPSIAQAFRDANDDSKVSAREFIDGLAEDTTSLVAFIENLNTIIEAGFVDVAGTLSEQGVEAAGQVAAELARAAREGNTGLLEETQAGLDARDLAIKASTTFLEDVLGPEYVAATGEVGALATDAFGEDFNPAEVSRIEMELAKTALSVEGQKVAVVAATEGADAAKAYGAALGLDEQTTKEAVKAGTALRNSSTTDAAAGGKRQGSAYGAGLAQGVKEQEKAARAAARSIADAIQAEVADALGIFSPSRVAEEQGKQFGVGLALGIAAQTAAVVASAEALALAAVDAVEAVPSPTLAETQAGAVSVAQVDPAIFDQLAAVGSATGDVTLTVAPGAVVVSFTGPVSDRDARRVGAAVLDGIVDAAAQRQIAVDIRASAGSGG